jgi:hypothetical protein
MTTLAKAQRAGDVGPQVRFRNFLVNAAGRRSAAIQFTQPKKSEEHFKSVLKVLHVGSPVIWFEYSA